MEDEGESTREPLWEELDAFASGPIPSVETPFEAQAAKAADPQSRDPEATSLERILAVLGASPTALDDIVRGCGLPASAVRATLLELELAGRVARMGGDLVQLLR
jgi:DNA processing protein